jgi:hypothetical protein
VYPLIEGGTRVALTDKGRSYVQSTIGRYITDEESKGTFVEYYGIYGRVALPVQSPYEVRNGNWILTGREFYVVKEANP